MQPISNAARAQSQGDVPADEPTQGQGPIIEFENVTYAVPGRDNGDLVVMRDVSFAIEAGTITCIMGTSGSGKTTLLRLMAGLIRPDSGRVKIFGRDITALSERDLNQVRRDMGFVFQYSALFDSLDVGENVGFGLERRRRPSREIDETVGRLLREVGLEGLERRRPSQLSGGMKKRVAMARALATNPRVVLYDEPDSGLDPIMTRTIDDLIVRIREVHATTNVVVTHNVASIWRIADRVLMLHEARIVADGTPAQVSTSTEPIVRRFLADVLPAPPASALPGQS